MKLVRRMKLNKLSLRNNFNLINNSSAMQQSAGRTGAMVRASASQSVDQGFIP